jgi:hypothetical protein
MLSIPIRSIEKRHADPSALFPANRYPYIMIPLYLLRFKEKRGEHGDAHIGKTTQCRNVSEWRQTLEITSHSTKMPKLLSNMPKPLSPNVLALDVIFVLALAEAIESQK